MVRLLHLADLHLGWRPPFLGGPQQETRQVERDCLLEKAVDYALDPSSCVHMVIIAGDLFDSHDPPRHVVSQAVEQLNRLVGNGVQVITVPGNHDEISYHNSVYRGARASWPGHLVTEPMPSLSYTFEVDEIPIHVYSMAYTGGLTDVRALGELPRRGEPGLHLGAFHGSLDWNPGERSLPISSEALQKAGYHYTALGHIHQHRVISAGSPAVYPGLVDHKSLHEPGVEHLTVVEFHGERAEIARPPISTRRHGWESIDVSSIETPEELMERCRRYGDRDAVIGVRLTGVSSYSIDTEALEESLADEFFHLEIDDTSSFLSAEEMGRYQDDLTVRGRFVRRMQGRLDGSACERERQVVQRALMLGLAALRGGDDG